MYTPRVSRALQFLRGRPRLTGGIIVAVAAVATLLLFEKSAIITHLRPGETLTVQLARDYKIQPYGTVVKIAGTQVGVVSGMEATGGLELMTLKLHTGTRRLLGTDPRAEVRPTTILGGSYYVQLFPGGAKGQASSAVIPVDRTALPVELDRLLSAIPPDAQHGLQGMLERLDSTYKAGVGDDLNKLLADAPATLRPTGTVVDALRGVNQDTDLAGLITNLDKTARVLNARPGQLRDVVDSLAGTARVLGANAAPIDRTFATLPTTLDATRNGADHLAVTLDKLTDTADDVRPTVTRLDPLLRELDPTLADLRPVAADLGPLLDDAEPLLHELAPTLGEATHVLERLDGPVLDRVNGPVLGELNNEWHGQAPKYPNGGGDGSKFYEQLGYMFANINNGVQYQSVTSHLLGFQAGGGSTSLYGDGPLAQSFQDPLSEGWGPPHQRKPTPIGPPLPGGIPVPGLPPLTKGSDK